MSKTCDRCGKKLNERDRTTICLECEVALADEVNEELEAENERLKHNTDAIWDIYQSSKRENAALREKLAAAKIPKEFEQTVEKLKQALALGGYPDLISAASYVLQMWDAWRGEQEGADDV